VHVSGIFDLYNPANRDLTKANTVLLIRIGPVQIGTVTGPDPVHLWPDHAFTSFQGSKTIKIAFAVWAPARTTTAELTALPRPKDGKGRVD